MPRNDSKRASRRVTFRDKAHLRRRLTVAGEALVVEQGRVTASDPDVVEALEARGDFERLGGKEAR